MPDRMPDRMPEDMSDRMPEDLPVRKSINVMVGITRSKVFFSMVFLPPDILLAMAIYGPIPDILQPRYKRERTKVSNLAVNPTINHP